MSVIQPMDPDQFDERLEHAVEDLLELLNGEANAVVGNP